LRGIRGALAARDVDVHAAVRQGQLQFHDVHEAVSAILPDGALDAARFQAAIVEGLARASADVRFYGVRWWGEISNVLHHAGDTRAALGAEELAGAAARKHDIRLLCSYLCDKFDSRSYDGILPELCRRHSHVIPTDDYVRHRLAVNRAIADVIGEIRGPLLQSLLAWEGPACDLPSSQELLFWLREAQPERFPEVLSRARAHH
jgi:hypothetical protein